jgi:hypothetical protein
MKKPVHSQPLCKKNKLIVLRVTINIRLNLFEIQKEKYKIEAP